MGRIKLSIIITAKDKNDPKLQDLLYSISKQTYPKDLCETLIITEGNSETAKAIGLKKAKGKIVGIFASDNYLNDPVFIAECMRPFEDSRVVGSYPLRYHYDKKDDILNRYFALMGVNDPIPFYLNKNDRYSYLFKNIFTDKKNKGYIVTDLNYVPTLGDNGFFIRKGILLKADIDNYFHIDVCQDLFDKGYKTYALANTSIWHRTGGNIIKFFVKRFKYADKFSENRRWRMVTKKDIPDLARFVFYSLTLIQPLCLSIRGFKKVKDVAWFLHPLVCLITLITYGVLWFQLSFRRVIVSLIPRCLNKP